MASAASRFEVEPLQLLLERDRRRDDAVAQRLAVTLSSLTIARAPAARPMKKALRLARRADSGLEQIETAVGKGIGIGQKVDSGLAKVAEFAGRLGGALGEDTALGKLAQQIGAGLGQGHEKLRDALGVAREGEELLRQGHDLLHRALEAAGDRDPTIDPPDFEELDSLAPDTWIGSGEGARVFSGVFAAFLPAEGAMVGSPHPGSGGPERERKPGFFAELFEQLEGFAERVGGWAEGSGRAAEKVQGFAGSAEKFLGDLGLHGLAGFAAKAGAAAGWVEDEAEVVGGAVKTADRWMGNAKKALGPLLDVRGPAPDEPRGPSMETLNLGRPPPDFRLAAEGEGAAAPAGISTAKRTRSRGDEAAGKDAPADGEEFLEEVSGRVYDLLMDDLEQAFESR